MARVRYWRAAESPALGPVCRHVRAGARLAVHLMAVGGSWELVMALVELRQQPPEIQIESWASGHSDTQGLRRPRSRAVGPPSSSVGRFDHRRRPDPSPTVSWL